MVRSRAWIEGSVWILGLTAVASVAWYFSRPQDFTDAAPQGPAKVQVVEIIELPEQTANRTMDIRFEIANAGGEDLLLDQFRTSCTCDGLHRRVGETFAKFDTIRLKPLEKVELRLLQQVRGGVGQPLRSPIYFCTNDPARPEVAVLISAPNILGGITASPSTVVFGEVVAGAHLRYEIELSDALTSGRAVSRVESTLPGVISTRWEPAPPTPNSVGDLVLGRLIVLIERKAPAPIRGKVLVYLDANQSEPTAIEVTGTVIPAVQAFPQAVTLPRMEQGKLVYAATCICKGHGQRPFELTAEKTPPGMKVSISVDPDDSTQKLVRIDCPPDGVARVGPVVIRLRAKIGEEIQYLDIPVSWIEQ